MTEARRVKIHYRRPPDREEIFDQVVVHETESVIVTLAESVDMDEPIRVEGDIVLERGSSVVWFTFPGLWHDVGRFHRADGTFTGYYANILTPPRIEGPLWYTTDLYLDVWRASGGAVVLLDRDELEDAVKLGHVAPKTAMAATREAERLLDLACRDLWPPPIAAEWTLERARAAV